MGANRIIAELLQAHLDSGYNLARWLTGNDEDARDVVQEASLRAVRFAGGYRGENGRAWFLSIVRNTCQTWLRRNRDLKLVADPAELVTIEDASPAPLAEQRLDAAVLARAIAGLPEEFREVLVLREIEELSYREIALAVGVPIGTVMSRLARARRRLLEIVKGGS